MALHGDAAALHGCGAAPLHVDEYAPLLDADAMHAKVGVLHNVEAGTGVGAGVSADVIHGQLSVPFAVHDNNLRSTVLLGAQRCGPLYQCGSKSRNRKLRF
jgi:hypothetical protein